MIRYKFLSDPNRKWCFMDLVTNHQTGKLRETALFSVVGKITLTWAMVYSTLHEKFNFELWSAYGVLVIGHEIWKANQNQAQQKLDREATSADKPTI